MKAVDNWKPVIRHKILRYYMKYTAIWTFLILRAYTKYSYESNKNKKTCYTNSQSKHLNDKENILKTPNTQSGNFEQGIICFKKKKDPSNWHSADVPCQNKGLDINTTKGKTQNFYTSSHPGKTSSSFKHVNHFEFPESAEAYSAPSAYRANYTVRKCIFYFACSFAQ